MKNSIENSVLSSLWAYRALNRVRRLGYSGKIMLVAFAGIHIPLIGLIAYLAVTRAPDMSYALKMVGVALLATLAGTGITLFLLNQLLKPIVLTSRGLRSYIVDRRLPELPTGFHDMAGTLMADADYALKRLEETINHFEHYDRVTALPNRFHFLRQLAERVEVALERPFAICLISIERLDDITATYGQEQCDGVLRHCVQQFEAMLDYQGGLSRVDSHTFALLLETDDLETISTTLATLDRSLDNTSHKGVDIRLDCRSGISLCPHDARDPQALMDNATTALDLAIREKVCSAFFSSASRDVLVRRHTLERDLRRALDQENELMLHYQPVVDLDGNTIIGAEALIRWQHPALGMVYPNEFIPLAEESDLIEHIGRWTLLTACRQIAAWREQGICDLTVSVNLSARQFNDPTFLAYVEQILVEFSIDPGILEVELTETSAMNDAAHTSAVMCKVRDLGVSIAIDDFGTGYSSLSYLSTMPFSKLKIDRQFVQNIASNADRQAICRALIALARELKLEVLAEGTETLSEVAMLREQGCNVFQGFYFYKPMLPTEFETIFKGAVTPFEPALSVSDL